MKENGKAAAMRAGMGVFVGLVVLTIIEFIISTNLDSAVLLFIVALIKAALIVNSFMHVARLWREESH